MQFRAAEIRASLETDREREQFDRMLKFFRTADTLQLMNDMMRCYIMDMSYSRPAIAQAHKTARLEKGWP